MRIFFHSQYNQFLRFLSEYSCHALLNYSCWSVSVGRILYPWPSYSCLRPFLLHTCMTLSLCSPSNCLQGSWAVCLTGKATVASRLEGDQLQPPNFAALPCQRGRCRRLCCPLSTAGGAKRLRRVFFSIHLHSHRPSAIKVGRRCACQGQAEKLARVSNTIRWWDAWLYFCGSCKASRKCVIQLNVKRFACRKFFNFK